MSLQPNRQNKMLTSHVYANHRYAQYLHFTCILPTFLFIWDLFLITQYLIHTLTSTETNNLNNKVKTKQRTDDTPSSFNWSFSAVHYDPLDSTWRYCPPVSHKTKQIVYEHLILIISHWDTCLSWVRCSKRGWLWTDGRDVTVQVLIFVDMKPLDTFNETFGHSPIMVPATKFIYMFNDNLGQKNRTETNKMTNICVIGAYCDCPDPLRLSHRRRFPSDRAGGSEVAQNCSSILPL